MDFGGIRYMQFDAVKNGGVTEWMKVAAMCEARGILMAPHHAPHFHVHLCAAVPHGVLVETFPNAKLYPAWPHLFDGFPECADGHVTVPDRPGWGMTINEAFLRERGTLVHWRD